MICPLPVPRERFDEPGLAHGAAGPQVAGQLAVQRAFGLHEQRPVDRFVRHPHLLIVGMVAAQPACDLERRPLQRELVFHCVAQGRARRQLRRLGPTTVDHRTVVGGHGPVPARAAVAFDLTRHRRRCPPQPTSDPPQRLAGSQPSGDLLTISQRQLLVAALWDRGPDTTGLTDAVIHRLIRPAQRARDHRGRLTRGIPIPQLGDLCHRHRIRSHSHLRGRA